MPIKIPSNLPAHKVLSAEGVMVMDPNQAARQDIRPLRIALLNLMPMKIDTENQFARLIGATPLQSDLSLIRRSEHKTKNTATEHMQEVLNDYREEKKLGMTEGPFYDIHSLKQFLESGTFFFPVKCTTIDTNN